MTATQRRQADLRSKGLCIWCGGRKRKQSTLCNDCLARQREGYSARREVGECTRCGVPADGWACEACKDAHNAARRARRNEKSHHA